MPWLVLCVGLGVTVPVGFGFDELEDAVAEDEALFWIEIMPPATAAGDVLLNWMFFAAAAYAARPSPVALNGT
jgi:hypothetical protein